MSDTPHQLNMSQQGHSSPPPSASPTPNPPPRPPPPPPPPPRTNTILRVPTDRSARFSSERETQPPALPQPLPLQLPSPPSVLPLAPFLAPSVTQPRLPIYRDQTLTLQSLSRIEEIQSPRKLQKVTTMTSTSSPSRSNTGKHPVLRGIRSRSGKWVSEIREPRKTTRIWLGTYPTPEMAAAAYDVAALALRGNEAMLNFPENVGKYHVPSSPSPPDIRRAAADAAVLMKREEEEAGHAEEAAAAVVGEQQGNDVNINEETVISSGQEFIDEEELFHMPNLLKDMAEGMLVSPPRIASPPSDASPTCSDAENLWNY